MRVERFVGLGGGFTEEGFQFRSRARIGQQLLPSLVVLLGEKEPGKVGDLDLLLRWQRFADANDFFRRSAHKQYLVVKGEPGTVRLARELGSKTTMCSAPFTS